MAMISCKECGKTISDTASSCPHCGAVLNKSFENKGRNRIVAALLAFFLGWFGAHKFYLGQIGWGVVYLLFFWTVIPAIAAFIEFILLLVMSDEKFDNRFNR